MKVTEKLAAKMRDLEGAPAVKISFLGDSVTQGCFEVYKTGETSLMPVFDPAAAYPARLGSMLEKMYPGTTVHILNAGQSGCDAKAGLERLERDVLIFRPDLTVVCFGLNDSSRGIDNLQTYRACMREIFTKLMQAGTEVIFLTPNGMNRYVSPLIVDPFTRSLAEHFREIMQGDVFDAFMQAGIEEAKSCKVSVCDFYAKWRAQEEGGADMTALLANHMNHPVREVHALLAASLVDTIFFTSKEN